MSLINDALKQAGKAQRENPPPPSPLHFRAADESPRRKYTSTAILFVVVFIALALGGVLIGMALQKGSAKPETVNAHQPDTSSTQAPINTDNSVSYAPSGPAQPQVPEKAVTTPATTTNTVQATTPTPDAPVAVNPLNGAQLDSTTNVAVAPIEPPKPAGPKLQGIYYNPSRGSSAVVSGRTVYVGNKVGEFRVADITKENVILISGTQTNVLSLSE